MHSDPYVNRNLHHIGLDFLEGEGEEGPELKGSVIANFRFRGEFISEKFGGITTRILYIGDVRHVSINGIDGPMLQ